MEKGISAFWLKIIAITGMVLQHTALSLRGMFPLPVEIFLQLAGGITFPVLAFFIVEGFRATSDLGKYKRRIMIFGFISILPHLFSLGSGLNIMFVLFFGLIVLEVRKKYGDDMVDQSNAKLAGITQEEYDHSEKLRQDFEEILLQAFNSGDPAGDFAMQACELHKQWLCVYYPDYSAEYHRALGEMYVADERFRANYDKLAPGCTEFLGDAINLYAQIN